MTETISARASRTPSIPLYSETPTRRENRLDRSGRRAALSFRRRTYIIGGAEGYTAIIRVFGGFIMGDAVARITSDVKSR